MFSLLTDNSHGFDCLRFLSQLNVYVGKPTAKNVDFQERSYIRLAIQWNNENSALVTSAVYPSINTFLDLQRKNFNI